LYGRRARYGTLPRFAATSKQTTIPKRLAGVVSKIVESVDRLVHQPHSGRPGRLAGTRELIVPGTPYVIPYRVRTGRLDLIAVFHGKQKWPKRL
jgi:toxin ParE1/3/4